MDKITIEEIDRWPAPELKFHDRMHLEFISSTKHDQDIALAARSIRHIPLLWLAVEILEIKYDQNRINDYVTFRNDNKKIEFIDRNGRVLARIYFEDTP